MAREHNDLRIEFELYYCLMQAYLGLGTSRGRKGKPLKNETLDGFLDPEP